MNDPYYKAMDDMAEEAWAIRNGARKDDYGQVMEVHQRIAAGWSVLLRHPVSAADVALCMAWLKMVRSTTSPEKLDHYIDGCNYIIMAGAMETVELPVDPEVISQPQCVDCGLPYEDPAFEDLVIDDDAWRAISPDGGGGGLLCANCIIRRLNQDGIKTTGAWRSGPLSSLNKTRP